MAEMIATSPLAGHLPARHGTVEAVEWSPARITSVAPYPGTTAQVSAALEAQVGAAFPGPNLCLSGREGALVAWSGLAQAFVIGPTLGPVEGAAVTDQTDAWAGIHISGDDAAAVLARLCPLDLRPDRFGAGSAARSLLGHMSALILRTDETGFRLLVFRSMAMTASHELEAAMRGVTARTALG